MTTEFQKRVYGLVRKIPGGRVSTYREIGNKLGKGQVYRAVGVTLKNSPGMPDVPCHRVVCSSGAIGGFNKGVKEKIKLLEKEGVKIEKNKINLKKYFFKIKIKK